MLPSTYLCFGTRPGTGNAALVADGAAHPMETRQALAAASGAGATVFLDEGGGVLDFYYPHARSVLCLHASLAAAAWLFARQGSDEAIEVRTAQRGQLLRFTREGGHYFIGLAAQAAPAVAADAAALLGAPCLGSALASVGSPKLLVEVADRAALDALAPDLARILAWGAAHGVNGIYAWCRLGEHHYAGRNFNHRAPDQEDRATGVAAAALTLHLGHGLILEQGGDCRMVTKRDGAHVQVGGTAHYLQP
jgi:predicted PhzF superfamily epimerase YddE/YHI9